MNENFCAYNGKCLEKIQGEISTFGSVEFRWDPFKMPNGTYVLNMSGDEVDLARFGGYVSQLNRELSKNAD